MKHMYNNPSLIQDKINALLWLWSDLDRCLEFFYELVLVLLSSYDDDFENINDCKCIIFELNSFTPGIMLFGPIISDLEQIGSFTHIKFIKIFKTKIRDLTFLSCLNLTDIFLLITSINTSYILNYKELMDSHDNEYIGFSLFD